MNDQPTFTLRQMLGTAVVVMVVTIWITAELSGSITSRISGLCGLALVPGLLLSVGKEWTLRVIAAMCALCLCATVVLMIQGEFRPMLAFIGLGGLSMWQSQERQRRQPARPLNGGCPGSGASPDPAVGRAAAVGGSEPNPGSAQGGRPRAPALEGVSFKPNPYHVVTT